MRRVPWDEEADAGVVMRSVLGGTVHQRDPGGGAVQLHDFDMELAPDKQIAVEVTREAAPEYQSTLGALDRREWLFGKLRCNWHLGMGLRYSVRELHSRAPTLLLALEAAGIDVAHLVHAPGPSPAQRALEELRALGARLVYALGEADHLGGWIDVGDSPVGGATAASVLVAVAEKHANLADNRRKLQSESTADERHLFIWVNSERHQVTAAMAGPLPQDAPAIPPLIDAVWIATEFRSSRVWRYSRREGWRDLGRCELAES